MLFDMYMHMHLHMHMHMYVHMHVHMLFLGTHIHRGTVTGPLLHMISWWLQTVFKPETISHAIQHAHVVMIRTESPALGMLNIILLDSVVVAVSAWNHALLCFSKNPSSCIKLSLTTVPRG